MGTGSSMGTPSAWQQGERGHEEQALPNEREAGRGWAGRSGRGWAGRSGRDGGSASDAKLAHPGHQSDQPWPVGFEEFYRERYLPLLHLAILLTGSRAVAEEIVQDAFIRSRHALSESDNPAAYVRAAVVNASRSHHRHNAVVARHRGRWLPGVSEPELRELADVMARLPQRQRSVIVLRYYADLSESEIAEMLGCAPGTVKSLASRGLARLKKMLED